jgi:hypothetical protein
MLDGEGADDESEDDEDDEDSDDVWQSPRSGFQARLEHVRSLAKGKRPMNVRSVSFEDEDDDEGGSDDDDLFERNLPWVEEDEDFIAHIQVYLSSITKNCLSDLSL